uniref:Si:dkey-65b12.6 n=1 Tax=Scleropages formosus TaxID=113540 RepID=A0A8C9SDT8_SCLFO
MCDFLQLNNQYVSLPFNLEGGKLSVFRSGFFGVVKTDFGLMLKFNWDSHVALTLPSSYSGEIGGLCGNWNGLADDDMMTPDKSLAKTPTAFGISWKVRDDPGCSSDCNDNKCPTCQPDLMDRYQKREFCGIITDRNGPFKDCHSKVDPKQYFDDCAYDMCLYQGHATALCAALGAYTSACQEASASVDVWRSDSLCPPSCKANSHYEVCATGCPQTCSDLTESSGCEGLPCTEGCVCDDGFLLSDGECVPVAECGCVHFGLSYKAGQVFFPEGLCKQRCVCQAGGRVQCDAYSCGPSEKCQVKDGVQACHPDGTGTCTVFGASQYRSFDSQSFSLSGDCMYKMVEVIHSHEKKTNFSVLVQQKSAGGDTMVTWTVQIEAYGYMIVIFPGTSWKIMVGEIKMNLPLTLENGKVKAYQNGFNVIVEMDFGLKVSYDGFSGVRIEIPSTYKGAVGGLCGNFNDDKADDFMLPSGVQAVSAEKFAEEWVNTQEGRTCHTGCGSQCPPTDEKKRPEAEKACSILTSKDGPVSQCHSLFPPQQHFQECVQDLITDPKNANMLCQHIQKYVALCQSAGITVKSWRTETFCSVRCPANSHYELCADTCSSTCASLSVSSKCPKCQEGCQCDDGFVFDGDMCVPLQDCGCFVDGHYYKSGESVMQFDCTEECHCEHGVFSCKRTECKPSELCTIQDGAMGCHLSATECPENSHYEPCGTACPASCGDLDAPTKCKMACVEGCQCNTGFARSGDKCVPLKSCGCTYEGQYYPSGKEFWADSKCTQQCKCNPASAKVECSKVKCKNSQVCDLRNGVRDCYPVSFGTCQGSGDPHYRTFDGKKFDFQGTCTYYLSKLVNTADPSLVPFEVRVQNQNRGRNRAVSYTKTVEITVYGSTVVLSKENPGKVLLNNQYVSLPFNLEGGKLSVFRSGFFGVVKTDFGLMLKFNWDSHVALTLPSSYSGEIGGLCGNWNGLADDDMMTPDKSLAKTPTAFGISWKVRDDPGCSSDCNDNKCPTCQPDLMDRYQKREFCGIITDRNGPFKDCHSKVDPKQYFDDCAYDMCLYQGHATALCAALGAYTSACQEASASVDVWRSDSLCPPSCKANSHYEVCATGCPQTCSDLTESSGCEGLPCTEGCACDDGFLLSDGECVPVAECGCVHFGRSYKAGQVFFPEVLCEQRCVCQAGGRVQCNAYGCGPNEKCQVKDGVQACHPDGTGTCTVFGASQYRSFDSQSFSLSGDCMYKMVEVIRSLEEKTTFSVLVQQKSAGGDTMVTRTVEIRVYEYKLAILPRVGEVKMNLPLTLENGKVKAYQNGFNVIVEMDFGLKVSYDGFSGVRIEIPSTYKGAVGGLCGNFNDDKADDFMLPSGVQAVSAEKFAEEWVNTQEGRTCHTGCGSQCPPTDEKKRPEAEKACSILTSKDGPVSQCHSLFPPQQHFQECVQDLITDPKNANMLCQHIQKYVALCQSAGITVKSWRTETFCSVRCPANSHYELCADTCSSTCASLSVSSKCPKCQEGCQCDDGFVFDGDVCVPLQDCGCFVDGHYYKSGQTVMWNNYPCMELTCREKEDCILKGDTGTAICVPRSKTSCWAIGDPHYQTFDGTIFGFQGTCSYTVIDGVISNIPLSLESDSIKFRQSGIRGIMETDFGFQVTFDWSTLFMVTVTSSYYDNLAGICGTYNANQTDDFTTPSGVVVTNITEWAQSWSVPDRDPFCWHYCKGYCPTCSDEDQELYSSTKYCGLIESKEGPFSQCHNTLAPEESASNCLYDVCLNKGRQEVYCAALTNYVAACQKVGGTVSPEWRQISNCRKYRAIILSMYILKLLHIITNIMGE